MYLHCRAGIGRTNLVAGCWIANAGGGGAAALERLNRLWRGNARSRSWPTVPETDEQPRFVRGWRAAGKPARARPAAAAAPARPRHCDFRDRVRGMMLGLAAGDALGHAVHGLPAGAWSDKTAMALCLADSLVAQDGADPGGPGRALPRMAARRALVEHRHLRRHQRGDQPRARGGAVDRQSLCGLARPGARRRRAARAHRPGRSPGSTPTPRAAIEAAVNAARVTHQAPLTLDAVRFLRRAARRRARGRRQGGAARAGFQPRTRRLERGCCCARRSASSHAGAWRGRQPRRMLRGKFAAVAALESALAAFEGGGDLAQCLRGRGLAPGAMRRRPPPSSASSRARTTAPSSLPASMRARPRAQPPRSRRSRTGSSTPRRAPRAG